jgi:hypothetical protein
MSSRITCHDTPTWAGIILGGLDDTTLSFHVSYMHTCIPQDRPRIARVSRESRDTRTQWGWRSYYTYIHAMSCIPRDRPRIARVSRESRDTQTQWGWTTSIHIYIHVYHRIVLGLPVYPGNPGILGHSGVGRHTLILYIYTYMYTSGSS